MSDRFQFYTDSVISPARRLAVVTPSDAADLAEIPKALLIGGAGTVSLIAADDTVAVTLTVEAGVLPIRVRRVRATGTTATGIVALY